MTARERVIETINHRIPDKVPIDLGGSHVSTFSARAYQNVRKALGLESKPCELTELFMYAAKVDDDVRQKLGIDTACLTYPVDTNGCRTNRLQRFVANDGAEAWIGADNTWDVRQDGTIVMYPKGDRTAPASTEMVPGGSFFNAIMKDRVPEFDEEELNAKEDWKDDFPPITDEIAEELETASRKLFYDTDYAIVGQFPYAQLGDGGVIAAPFVKYPKGPRRMDDFLAATLLCPEYIEEVFEMQTENAMKNLEIYKQAVGNRIQVILVSTADYGSQAGTLISPDLFRELYKPHYKKINDWIHENTEWKVMYHCCGSVVGFMDDYIDMGCDILNPVQLSAKDMDAQMLNARWGEKMVFWGGGTDSQKTLSFGKPEDVYEEVLHRLTILSKNGGYVFNPVHNIVSDTKVDNILAMFDAVHQFNKFK